MLKSCADCGADLPSGYIGRVCLVCREKREHINDTNALVQRWYSQDVFHYAGRFPEEKPKCR